MDSSPPEDSIKPKIDQRLLDQLETFNMPVVNKWLDRQST